MSQKNTLSPILHPLPILFAANAGISMRDWLFWQKKSKQIKFRQDFSYFTQHSSSEFKNKTKSLLILNQTDEWSVNTESSTSVGYSQRWQARYGALTEMNLSSPSTPKCIISDNVLYKAVNLVWPWTKHLLSLQNICCALFLQDSPRRVTFIHSHTEN